jgi:ABC-type phosphate/phosphonate transport system permease subunit
MKMKYMMKYTTEENAKYAERVYEEVKKEIKKIKEDMKKMSIDELNAILVELDETAKKIDDLRWKVWNEYTEFAEDYIKKYNNINKLPEEKQEKIRELFDWEDDNVLQPTWRIFNSIINDLSSAWAEIDSIKVKILEEEKHKIKEKMHE